MGKKNIVGGQFKAPVPSMMKVYLRWVNESLSACLDSVGKYANEKISIEEVRYVEKASRTIVKWSDGTKTVAKCHPDDKFDKHMGLAICVLKKLMSSNEYHALFGNWIIDDMEVVTHRDAKMKMMGIPRVLVEK